MSFASSFGPLSPCFSSPSPLTVHSDQLKDPKQFYGPLHVQPGGLYSNSFSTELNWLFPGTVGAYSGD